MVLLSILFFSMAAWNVGIVDAPSQLANHWNESFQLDLGTNQTVQYAYFWVKSGNATVTIYSGAPDNWENVGNSPFRTNHRLLDCQTITLGSTSTRYLEFNIKQ